MIRPIIDYVSVVWTSCDKHTLIRVLKLQKRAARVILDANRQANSVKLFNKLNWIPFSEQAILTKCCIIYKRLQGHVPVVVQFYSWFNFYFPLFYTHYHSLPYTKTKENKN